MVEHRIVEKWKNDDRLLPPASLPLRKPAILVVGLGGCIWLGVWVSGDCGQRRELIFRGFCLYLYVDMCVCAGAGAERTGCR